MGAIDVGWLVEVLVKFDLALAPNSHHRHLANSDKFDASLESLIGLNIPKPDRDKQVQTFISLVSFRQPQGFRFR